MTILWFARGKLDLRSRDENRQRGRAPHANDQGERSFRDPRAVAITAAVRGMLKSSTIIRGLGGTKEVVMARLRNPHPGEILKEEFLSAIGMSQNQLAL